MVILSEGGVWLKSADVKPGDTLKILSEGEWVENQKFSYEDGSPKKDFIVRVVHSDQEKNWRVNGMNRQAVKSMYGNDTSFWIGKTIKVTTEQMLVAGKRMKVVCVIKVDKDGKEISWDE